MLQQELHPDMSACRNARRRLAPRNATHHLDDTRKQIAVDSAHPAHSARVHALIRSIHGHADSACGHTTRPPHGSEEVLACPEMSGIALTFKHAVTFSPPHAEIFTLSTRDPTCTPDVKSPSAVLCPANDRPRTSEILFCLAQSLP